jgi:phosphohistidine phosphatase
VKRLTLMRHADAQWKDPEIADFTRPLNRRGAAEAEAMAHRFTELKLVPDLVLASSARRAQQTADIVARELALNVRQLRYEEALYLARAQDILAIVHSTGSRVSHLMIVGHNPGISELANLLVPAGGGDGLATAAIRSITFDTHSWSGVISAAVLDVQNEAPVSGLLGLFA